VTDWTQRIGPGSLCRFEAKYGDPVTAFEYFTMAMRNYLDSGKTPSESAKHATFSVAPQCTDNPLDR